MSLINDMLRDLEHRHAGGALGRPGSAARLSAAEGLLPNDGSSFQWFLLPMLLGLTVVGGVYLTFFKATSPSLDLAELIEPARVLPDAPAARERTRPAFDVDVAATLPLRADVALAATSIAPEPVSERSPAAPATVRSFALRLTGALTGPVAQAATARRDPVRPATIAPGHNGPGARQDKSAGLPPELLAEAAQLNALLRAAPPAAIAATPVPEARLAPAPDDVLPLRKTEVAPATPGARASAAFARARRALANNDLAGAEQSLLAALASDPDYVEARELLAARLVRRGRLDDATAVLREGLARLPTQRRFAKLQARVLVELGQLDEALAVLLAARPGAAGDSEFHAFTAAVLQRSGRHGEAVDLYREVLAQDGGRGVWWMGLGISLEALGRGGEALDAFRRAQTSQGLAVPVQRFLEAKVAALRG